MNDLPPNSQPSRILITAGSTQEPIDEVRFLGNRSSGKLGALLALAAADSGYEVTLLHGPRSALPSSHPRLHAVPFTSSRDLKAKLDEYWPSHSILIMAAAVSDYTPKGGQVDGKLKRGKSMSLDLVPTEDIVASLSTIAREDQRIIAFALGEPEELNNIAQAKLIRKGVDAIVANPLETMESSKINATVLLKDGSELNPPALCSKAEFSRWLIENLNLVTRLTPHTK
jgi:phosphopantothenoylcysteine decarboxylase/phosphopantothenate--cysteine ligase